jgi:hypothetical protein
MTGIVDSFHDELVYLRSHMRPTFVTFREFIEWRHRDPEGIDSHYAEDFAKFVRKVAVEADLPRLVAVADDIIRTARASVPRSTPLDPDTGAEMETLPHQHWQQGLDREAKRDAEPRERPARWAARDRVTTSDIAGRLWPDERPGFATTYVFGLLKDLGYVEGAPRNWRLTEKGSAFGELKGRSRYVYWTKEMLDVVRTELERRRATPDPPEDMSAR